jgi:hypothetical protein
VFSAIGHPNCINQRTTLVRNAAASRSPSTLIIRSA